MASEQKYDVSEKTLLRADTVMDLLEQKPHLTVRAACKERGMADSTFRKARSVSGALKLRYDEWEKFKLEGDVDRTKNSMMKRIVGFYVNETTRKIVDGKVVEEIVKKKYFAPSDLLIMFFLKNKGGYDELVKTMDLAADGTIKEPMPEDKFMDFVKMMNEKSGEAKKKLQLVPKPAEE